MKKAKIITELGVKTKVRELLNVSYPTVRKALRGDCDSELSRKIRHLALELGGVEIANKKSN